MARGRMISKSLSTSEKYAALVTSAGDLSEFCHALYPLIVSHADDFGRLQGDLFTIKHQCYPASLRTLEEFATALSHLHDVKLIEWYTVARKKYVQILKFDKHQTGLHKRTKSAFPRFPGTSGNVAESPGQLKRTQENLTKENLSTKKEKAAASPPSASARHEDPKHNVGVITKLAHEAIDKCGLGASLSDITDTVKSLCALRDIDYDGITVRKALDSALVQRKRASA